MFEKITIGVIVCFAFVYAFKKIRAEIKGSGGCCGCSDEKKSVCGCRSEYAKDKDKKKKKK